MPPAFLPDAPDAPRVPWRGLALLATLVALAHLALLGLTAPGSGPRPSPLAQTFITRSIVIAPAPAPEPEPPAELPEEAIVEPPQLHASASSGTTRAHPVSLPMHGL